MPRPTKTRKVKGLPRNTEFCPKGQQGCSHPIILNVEEYEAIRLIDYVGLTQEECAISMGVGRATVQSLYVEARKKLARFVVEASGLRIEGGDYEICSDESIDANVIGETGDSMMKIAVTYENGYVFQHFGHTKQFKIYEAEDGKIVKEEVIDTNGRGHGALAGFLKENGVDVLICGGIGGGARNALAEAGIRLFPGAAGDADAQAASFLSGSLNYNPNTICSHHRHEEGNIFGEHGCGEGHHCGNN